MPKHFKHKNYSSFVRQLNLYHFYKDKQADNKCIFKNSYFQRDNPKLLFKIKKKNKKFVLDSISKYKSKPVINISCSFDNIQTQLSQMEKMLTLLEEKNKEYKMKNMSLINEHYQLSQKIQKIEKIVFYIATIISKKSSENEITNEDSKYNDMIKAETWKYINSKLAESLKFLSPNLISSLRINSVDNENCRSIKQQFLTNNSAYSPLKITNTSNPISKKFSIDNDEVQNSMPFGNNAISLNSPSPLLSLYDNHSLYDMGLNYESPNINNIKNFENNPHYFRKLSYISQEEEDKKNTPSKYLLTN